MSESRVEQLEKENKRLLDEKEHLKQLNSILRHRTDLPIERVRGYDEIVAKLNAADRQIESLKTALGQSDIEWCKLDDELTTTRRELDAARKDRDEWRHRAVGGTCKVLSNPNCDCSLCLRDKLLDAANAQAAAMRDALEICANFIPYQKPDKNLPQWILDAKSTAKSALDGAAGRKLLERVRRYEEALRRCKEAATEGADQDDTVVHHTQLRMIESLVENALEATKRETPGGE